MYDELDVLGPLGHGFDVGALGSAPVFIGGGIGVPPMLGCVREAVKQGAKPAAILGFRNKGAVILEGDFRDECETFVTTDDGSYARHGFVTDVHLIPPVESRSYIDMTRAVQAAFGVHSRWLDETTLLLPGGQQYHPCDYNVEGDYSQAAFPAVLGAVCGGVTITGLAPDTLQGDAAILDVLRRCGAAFTRKGDSVTFA